MIEIANVTGGYPGRRVLDGISAVLKDGMLTGIIGPNGCGKTTLFRAVCGEISLDAGKIFINGEDSAKMGRRQRAQRVARFHQERRVPDMTVRALCEAGRYPFAPFAGRMGKEDVRIVDAAMERCGVMQFAERELKELSGGERQRAYIAMLLSQGAKNILLDEPAAFLDPAARFAMMDIFRDLADEGYAVGIVMHDAALAMEYCSEIIVMEKGRCVFQGKPDEAAGKAEAVFGIRLEKTASGAYAAARG